MVYFSERKEWRKWLEENFEKEKDIWLIYPKNISEKPRIKYNDAVEEALCFGWIDSVVKTLDEKSYVQRYSPRKSKSEYSQSNKERLKWLARHKMIHPKILSTVQSILDENFRFPSDILEEIKKDKIAWDNFNSCSEPYKRIRIAYIDGTRKQPDEFKKRLKNFIEKTKKNKIISGFGGIDKYY